MLKTTNDWGKAFKESGLSPELVTKYTNYVDTLICNDVPVIFDFNHLSLLLGKNKEFLGKVINSSNSFYREFIIPKRSGGNRVISAPYPSLLECQRWILDNILYKIKINNAAHGFYPKRSIITNVRLHLNQKQFLKIDLKDFFPSIGIDKVITIFRNLGYNKKVSFYLSSILCQNEHLPQGSPSSPMISNIVCKSMDNRLVRFAKRFKLKYTRYADDIALSGDMISFIQIKYVTDIINDCGFQINESKTKLLKGKGKRILTGISISTSIPKVPKDYKRKLIQEIYYIKKYGYEAHVRERKIKNPKYIYVLLGKFNFWLSVEPENIFVKNSLIILKEKLLTTASTL